MNWKMMYLILLLVFINIDKVHPCAYTSVCRSRVNHNYYNGTSYDTNDLLCYCEYHLGCPNYWTSDAGSIQILSVRLFSDTAKLTAELMICGDFTALVAILPSCSNGQTAIEMFGSAVPIDIRNWHCLCTDSNPMFYQSIQRNARNRPYISYICDNQKVICEDAGTECYTQNSVNTTYPCDCPTGFWCDVNRLTNVGYCSRLSRRQ